MRNSILYVAVEQGAKVSAHYHSTSSNLDTLSKDYGPDRVQAVKADLTQEQQVADLFVEATRTYGPIHVVIVNHAYLPPEAVPLARMTLDQWNSTVSQDLTSPFLVIRRYLQDLAMATELDKEKAAIVFVGSAAGKFGAAGHADYAACKSGECATLSFYASPPYHCGR